MLTRRDFVKAAAAAAVLPLSPRSARALPDATRKALEMSGLVYVSPLLADGSESTCHAEIWFGWIEGQIVVITRKDGWRARSVRRGLDRARIWVGDHGQWKRLIGNSRAFLTAPHLDARAKLSSDGPLFERLMKEFSRKYPKEFPDWDERMRSSFAAGDRVLVRYSPA
jgi:hypothetical protein